MSLVINTNLEAMTANGFFKSNSVSRAKGSEKLSSGYKINRSADDAAGLTISEAMRSQIRGLRQGTENAMDGISWVQIGDGALDEVSDMIHRMKQLSVKAANGTNTVADRAAIEKEFNQLQSEIDRVTNTTEFNTLNIFDEHEYPYYQLEGNVEWDIEQPHYVMAGQNDLTITFQKDDLSGPETVTFTVPEGIYTTQELIDEIDDAMIASGISEKGLILELTGFGTCNLNYEGGEKIDCVGGGLSYLLYDIYHGASAGALIGTTVFKSDYSSLPITKGQNDHMSFEILDAANNSEKKDITIPPGSYTRNQLIGILNTTLAGTGVEAVKFGTGIKLQSDEKIITGFSGNMFKLEVQPEDPKIYTSVFYDNIKYGNTTKTSGVFTGGYVLTKSTNDEKHNRFKIDSTNNELIFQPNDSASSVKYTIADGEYTASQIVSDMNTFFTTNGVKLKAAVIDNGSFQGIKITSDEKGNSSKVGLDPTSSAYDTLFVKKAYDTYSTKSPTYDTTTNRYAKFNGKQAITGAVPLTITTGVNDSFKIKVDATTYTITVPAGTYTSATDLASAINSQIAAGPLALKDGVKCETSGNCIILTGKTNVTSVSAAADGANTGYDSIFVGKTEKSSTQTAKGTGSVTLDNAVGNPMDIPAGKSSLTVNVNGSNRTVTLPTGSVSQDDVVNAINTQLAAKTTTTNNTFTATPKAGTNTDNNFSVSSSGSSKVNAPAVASSTTTGTTPQGSTDPTSLTPASVSTKIPSTVNINSSNNHFSININGVSVSYDVPAGTYTAEQLKNKLQTEMDKITGQGPGTSVVFSLSGGNLSATLRDKVPGSSEYAGIIGYTLSWSNGESSLLTELNTTRTNAQATAKQPLKDSIVIAAGSNEFKFSYNDGSGNKTVSVTLDNGTYTRDSFKNMLNTKLAAAGYNVTAGLDGSKLTLKNNTPGAGTSIAFSSTAGGTASEAMYGDLITKTAATLTTNTAIQSSIAIEDGKNTFTINVNGTPKTVTLDNGTYTRSGFVAMLNSKLAAAGAGVTASLNGSNALVYTSTAKGAGNTLDMTYAAGGSSMKPIYGSTTSTVPAVTASFEGGKLKLSSPGNTLEVKGTSGSIFETSTTSIERTYPTASTGYTSSVKGKIQGESISEPIVIDRYNDDLKFDFYKEGVSNSVSISVPEGSYTYSTLQSKLQELIDAKTGAAGDINVTVNSSGVKLETKLTGSTNRMVNFGGGFYRNVICKATEHTSSEKTSNKDGEQIVSDAFAVGRKNVSGGATIRAGIDDVLKFKIHINSKEYTMSMKLDAGQFGGDGLIDMIQGKLNEQLVAAGLPEDMIKVGIGGISTGVTGSNDANALNFKLNSGVDLPELGTYYIDGFSGNAAFSLFYQTDGELIPAYISGNKDTTDGVIIKDGETDFSFDVDGVPYSIDIPAGNYTQEEIKDKLNELFEASSMPVAAGIENGTIRISMRSFGKHIIDNVSGGAKDDLFFRENHEGEKEDSINIQLSKQRDDYEGINRQHVNTCFLGINSITVSGVKYAQKAMGRLDTALDKLSAARSYFGAKQNALEKAVAINQNTTENTEAAESRIRDTDMAAQMVAYSRDNILLQASEAMLSQAYSSKDAVMTLLG